MYDIIGDLHGEAQQLIKMLEMLGYTCSQKGYSHPNRKAVFVGDFVDKGSDVLGCLEIVKQMCDNDNALAVVGNHELNLLAYFTKDSLGFPLREHSTKNRTQLKQTLIEFAENPEKKIIYLKWLRTLPIFLEFDSFRIVHACWNNAAVKQIIKKNPDNCLTKKFLRKVYDKKGKTYDSLILLLKGRELQLPGDLSIRDTYGFKRDSFRIKWWDSMDAHSFQSISFGNRFVLPNYTIPKELTYKINAYSMNEKPVFFGHYCLEIDAGVIRSNLCCVDSCVVNTGRLIAYRWDDNKVLSQKNIIAVD